MRMILAAEINTKLIAVSSGAARPLGVMLVIVAWLLPAAAFASVDGRFVVPDGVPVLAMYQLRPKATVYPMLTKQSMAYNHASDMHWKGVCRRICGIRKTSPMRTASEYIYVDSCSRDRSYPVRMAKSPYTPVTLLKISARDMSSVPVCKLMRPNRDYIKRSVLHPFQFLYIYRHTFGRGTRRYSRVNLDMICLFTDDLVGRDQINCFYFLSSVEY